METPTPNQQQQEKPLAPPIPLPAAAAPASGGAVDNTMGGLIPTRNPNALWAYYIGLFSLIPGIGMIMGPVAVVLGILGLRHAKNYPVVKGKAHAWVGIVCGGLWTLVYYGLAFTAMRLFFTPASYP